LPKNEKAHQKIRPDDSAPLLFRITFRSQFRTVEHKFPEWVYGCQIFESPTSQSSIVVIKNLAAKPLFQLQEFAFHCLKNLGLR